MRCSKAVPSRQRKVLWIASLITVCILEPMNWVISQEAVLIRGTPVTASCFDRERNQAVLGTESVLSIVAFRQEPHAVRGLDPTLNSSLDRFLPGKDLVCSRQIGVPIAKITKIELSPNSKYLLVAGGEPGVRGSLQCMDWPMATTGELIQTGVEQQPIEDVVTDVSWFPSGEQWIESHWTASVLVRRLDGSVVGHFSGHTGPVLRAIPWNEELGVSAGMDQTIKIWRIASGDQVQSLDNHTGPVIGLIKWIGPDGKPLMVSLGQDRTVRLWDPLIGRLIRFLKLPEKPVLMELSRSGSLVVLLQNHSAIQVSLPLLRIEQTVKLGEQRATRIVQSEQGVWYHW